MTQGVRGSWTTETSSRLLDRLDELAGQLTVTIRGELASYHSVPFEEHKGSVARQLKLVLCGIRDRMDPRPSDLLAADATGRRRAEEELPVSDLLLSYEVAIQALWRVFADEGRDDERAVRELADLAPAIWTWMHKLGAAAVGGHQLASASQLAGDVRLRRRLLELIATDPNSAECATLATELGLDPAGQFRAIAFVPDTGQRELERLQLRLHIDARGALAGPHGTEFVVVEQLDRRETIDRLSRPLASGSVLGFGLRRTGLDGAGESIRDAVLAVRLARRLRNDVDFADHWLLATVFARAEHLENLWAGVEIAVAHPHLASTVLAFADSGCSAATTARAQHLHANTVAYRLDRWQQLTGWSLEHFEGLARSVVAVRLSGATAPA